MDNRAFSGWEGRWGGEGEPGDCFPLTFSFTSLHACECQPSPPNRGSLPSVSWPSCTTIFPSVTVSLS